MNRKGQITLFIIVGIVLLIIAGLVVFIVKGPAIIRTGKEDLPTVQAYVEECLEEVSYDAIYLLGEQGGYIYFDSQPVYHDEIVAAYHCYEGRDVTPTVEAMEAHISTYVILNMERCLDDFSSYRHLNMNIQTGEMKADTIVGIDDVFIKLDYSVSYAEEDGIKTINQFTASVPVRLGHIQSIVKDIAEKRLELPKQTDLEFLSRFDIEINVRYMGDRDILFEITDPLSKEEKRGDYLFNTLVKLIP